MGNENTTDGQIVETRSVAASWIFHNLFKNIKRELALAASISLMQLRFSTASSATVLPLFPFFFFLRLRLILVKA